MTILLLGLSTITFAQKSTQKIISADGLKDMVKTHEKVALLPFTFAEKEYSALPDGITDEIVAKSELEKGLSLQMYVHERLAKKNGKRPYQWISIEDTNKHMDEDLSGSAIAKALGVDAVVTSVVETSKIIIPDEAGGEYTKRGIGGTDTFVVMAIYTADSEEAIWKWKLKMNGSFKNTKLMAATLAKNYLADKFPYKF
jgi:hypothetical protein